MKKRMKEKPKKVSPTEEIEFSQTNQDELSEQASPHYQSEEERQEREQKENNLIEKLSPQEKQVYQRLMIRMTEQSIANQMNITRGSITQIKARIADKVNRYYKINKD